MHIDRSFEAVFFPSARFSPLQQHLLLPQCTSIEALRRFFFPQPGSPRCSSTCYYHNAHR